MESGFYRQGLWARELVEITDDASRLEDGNFWAVLITYEGAQRFARFADVRHQQFGEFLEYASAEEWHRPTHEWSSSLSHDEYLAAVVAVRKAIEQGDVYQMNLCRILSTRAPQRELLALFPRLVHGNPAPFLTSLELPELSIASASPELLVRREGDLIISSPIKGTAKTRGELLEKDRAENVMIVDLVRHDFGSICKTGTITTPRLLDLEEHPGLVHLVSDVQGNLKVGTRWSEIFRALLPAGSISGAPKSSALQLINTIEKSDRGPYCGAIGWVQGDRGELAVGIRTFWIENEVLKFGTGAGITWGSDPQLEWVETELKAHRLLSLINRP
ncbi:MAG: anthranilate synthase component I family protein [Actinobacteria bacterium]|nr:anthranilate synthase component I family protein [Actinomycetota bacterium]